MRVRLHRKVHGDVSGIMDHYEALGGPQLADEFYRELYGAIKKASVQPGGIRIVERDLRRVNLKIFPYHFLFRIAEDSMRILVVRHHRRNPSFGLERD